MSEGTVLVTGGTGALGGAVVEAMLDAGWHVVATWVVPEERDRMGERDGLDLAQADLFDEQVVEELVRGAASGRRPLRAVVNLVGGYSAGPRLHETTLADFERMYRLNLRPTFLVTRAAAPYLIDAGGGAIVCVSARAALQPFPGAAAYASSKAAVQAFAKAVAADYRDERCALQRSPAERDRHRGKPRVPARRRSLALGAAGRDRRGDPVPVLGRVGAGERRRGARLRPRLAPPRSPDRFPHRRTVGGQRLVQLAARPDSVHVRSPRGAGPLPLLRLALDLLLGLAPVVVDPELRPADRLPAVRVELLHRTPVLVHGGALPVVERVWSP